MLDKKGYTLRGMPEDIRLFLIKEQAKHRVSNGLGQFSIEQTIYKLLRELIRCRTETDFKP